MDDDTTTFDVLRHFASLDYRYQLEDTLAQLEPITEAVMADLKQASRDADSEVRCLALRILEFLEDDEDPLIDCYSPKLSVEHLVTLLRQPHPDHGFFDPEPYEVAQGKLRIEYSTDAILHVALAELVEHRAKDAVSEILNLIENPSTSDEVSRHAERAVFDITGTPLSLGQHRFYSRDVRDAIPALRTLPHSDSLVPPVDPEANTHGQRHHTTNARNEREDCQSAVDAEIGEVVVQRFIASD